MAVPTTALGVIDRDWATGTETTVAKVISEATTWTAGIEIIDATGNRWTGPGRGVVQSPERGRMSAQTILPLRVGMAPQVSAPAWTTPSPVPRRVNSYGLDKD